jgi:hypothetical protein
MSDSPGQLTEAVIEVAGLRMRYGSFEAVRDIDLRVIRGEGLPFLARTVPGRQPRWRFLRVIAEGRGARSASSDRTRSNRRHHMGPSTTDCAAARSYGRAIGWHRPARTIGADAPAW